MTPKWYINLIEFDWYNHNLHELNMGWMIPSTLSPQNTSKGWGIIMMISCGERGVGIVMAMGKIVSAPLIAK
jgi:hypothetical protein